MEYCEYYQANIEKKKTGFFVATVRANEHCFFDRTLDKSTGLFEFFVPGGCETIFLRLMDFYKRAGIVSNLKKLSNRLISEPL